MATVLTAAAEQAIWERGTLTCLVVAESPSVPGEPGQGREGICQFRPGDKGAEETYVGKFQLVGTGIGSSAGFTIMWVVKTPVAKKTTAGLLEQAYSADATTGVGKQAPLVGARDSSIVLQSAASRLLPSMALGRPMPAIVMIAELKLKSSPA